MAAKSVSDKKITNFKLTQNPIEPSGSKKVLCQKCSELGELTSILKEFLVYSCRLQENWRFVVFVVVKFQKFLHTASWKKIWKCNFSIYNVENMSAFHYGFSLKDHEELDYVLIKN